MRPRTLLIVLALFALAVAARADGMTVRMYVFKSPTCNHCAPVERESIEAIAKDLGCTVEIKYFDIEQSADYLTLCDLEKTYGKTGNDAPVVFIGSDVLGGEEEAAKKMHETIGKYAKTGTPWPSETHQAEQGTAATISFEKTELDLGEVKSGTSTKAVFHITSTGTADLTIKRLRSSCDCLRYKAGFTRLAPGAAGDIEVTIDTVGITGPFSKIIMVDSNDADHLTVRLVVSGIAKPVAACTPKEWNFGSTKTGTVIKKSITITPASQKGFRILTAKSDGERVTVKKITKGANGTYTLDLIMKAGTKPGRVYEKLLIRTIDANGPLLQLIVFGNIDARTN